MKLLVTGVAGFIGCHVATSLLRNGHTVLGIDNMNSYYDADLKRSRLTNLRRTAASGNLELVLGDVADAAEVTRCVDDFEPQSIIHLAAQAGVRYSLIAPETYISSNVVGFFNILEAARRHSVEHLVYASSSSVYGKQRRTPFAESDCVEAPVSLYAATKKSNELMAYSYSHLFGIPTTGLRFFTVYGPWGRPDMAYYSFTKAILAGQEIQLFNHGQQQRDFTYIDDVVAAVEKIVAMPPLADGRNDSPPYRILNIGNHNPVALNDFVTILEGAIGKKAHVRLVDAQPGDVPETYADIRLARDLIGFTPRWDLAAGLERFVEWYLSYEHSNRP